MRRSVNVILAGAAVTLAATACSDGTGDRGEPGPAVEKEVLVAHFVSDCVGVGPQQCLNVRESAEAEWTLWYDPIEGFEHEAGYDYRLLVNETTVNDPPADASSIRWTLVEVLEKTAVATDGAGANPILRPWRLEAFGPAADLGDEATTTLIEGALASLPANNPVTLGLLAEGRVGGFDGCNRYFGDFRIENGHQIVQGPKGATLMACPDGRMDLEQAFLRNLDAATRLFLRGEGLELENDAGVVMIFAPWEGSE
jgi:heat shock protein HslJ